MLKNLPIIAGWRLIACLIVIACGMLGCGGGSSSSQTTTPTASVSAPAQTVPTQTTQPTALSLAGVPSASVTVGTNYNFSPSVTAPTDSKLTYSIQNKPAWASFDTASGALSGSPAASDVGTYSNIVISVADASATASLAGFAIAVTDVTNGTATVSWNIPTTNSDGTPLTNLAGFRIYYGTAADSMTKVAQIANSGVSTHVLTDLSPANWYIAVKAYTSAGVESALSNTANKTIN
jgi:Putative Ig domain